MRMVTDRRLAIVPESAAPTSSFRKKRGKNSERYTIIREGDKNAMHRDHGSV